MFSTNSPHQLEASESVSSTNGPEIPKRKSVLVQRYLNKPFLINGSKFDLRVYVYVTCYDPLRIYVFNDGLTRFATMK